MSWATEYTTPFDGTPYYSSTGVIKAVDRSGTKFAVGEITYQRFDDQNFQYVFSPYWDELSMLPASLFHGIPGIDLNRRREHYYRVNITPAFIEMRTPSPSRVDLWDLLEEVNLDYYDRFEWLLRTNKRCGDDNLIVERKRKSETLSAKDRSVDLNDLQRGDEVAIHKLYDLHSHNEDMIYTIYRLLCSAATIRLEEENRALGMDERKAMVFLLREILEYKGNCASVQQRDGIEQAKRDGKYMGRKRNDIDPLLLHETISKYREGVITVQDALAKLGISRSTFYRRMRELNTPLGNQQFDR